MTHEQINTKIAEVCGWTQIHEPGLPGLVVGKAPERYQGQPTSYPIEPVGVWWEIPDYCNDLNAMREAENELFSTLDWSACNYETLLQKITTSWAWHATARQRAEAFLRTLNLWEE